MLGLYTFAEEELMWFSQDTHFAHSSSTIGVSQGRYKRVGNILFFIIPENDLGFSAQMPGSLWNFVFFWCQRITSFLWSFLLRLKLKNDLLFLLLTLSLSFSVFAFLTEETSLNDDDREMIEPDHNKSINSAPPKFRPAPVNAAHYKPFQYNI